MFLIAERIQLRYHCRSDHITANKREFLRRMEVDSKGNKIIMTPDMCISFEVGSGSLAGMGGMGWSEEKSPGATLSWGPRRTGVEGPEYPAWKFIFALGKSRPPIWE